MEVFSTFAVVIMIVVGVAGIELAHVALAERHAGVDHFEIFVVVVAIARNRFVVAHRPRRTLLARAATFGSALAVATAAAATTSTATTRLIVPLASWRTKVTLGLGSLFGEFVAFTIEAFFRPFAISVGRTFVAAARRGSGIAIEVAMAARSIASSASAAIASRAFTTSAVAPAAAA